MAAAHGMEVSDSSTHLSLQPTMTSTVEKAIQEGMEHIKRDLSEHSTHITEAKMRLSSVEGEPSQSQATEQAQDKTNQSILQKIEDLENRSRLNNLRFVGVPESFSFLPHGILCL